MVLVPQDEEAEELEALEEALAKAFPEQSSYVRHHTKDLVALRDNYAATGVKLVYKYLVDVTYRGRTPLQDTALEKAAAFIQKFDHAWVAPR